MCIGSIVTAFEAKLKVFVIDVAGKKTFSHTWHLTRLLVSSSMWKSLRYFSPLFKFICDPFVGTLIGEYDMPQAVMETCELKANLQLQ